MIPAEPVVPPDPPPAPDATMQQRKPCNLPGVLPTPPVGDIPQAQTLLDLDKAHEFSTGKDVTVGIIDTGVDRNPRLRDLEGAGDYVDSSDGLVDCDMHGTLVASIIAAARGPGDQFVGVSPDVKLLSIRQSSAQYSRQAPPDAGQNPQQAETAGKIDALAAAIVRLANMGARVINMSVVACIPAAHPIDQTNLAVAVRYAAVVKDVLLVAAAGNVGAGNADCQLNPDFDSLNSPDDPRNWNHVVAVSTPSWFYDYVLSVGAVDNAGAGADKTNAAKFSMTGPWVDIAAPGVDTIALGPDGNAVNALPGQDGLVNLFGTSFSAAYVSGVAALVRSKYPDWTAAQVRRRLTSTAHAGPRGVDNAIGYGLVDPVAALTYDGGPGDRNIVETHHQTLVVQPPPPPPDTRAQRVALLASVVMIAAAGLAGRWLLRRRSRR
ncbi:type VII secretion-associated serine protease mycosin [Mycobacterium dioxanotrophicus]|nr:type VII secretion-associated serine protease mycosin [Mycobacterium dioxanotrophicus]